MQETLKSPPIAPKAARWPFIVGPLWLITVGVGLAFMWVYAGTPGSGARAGAWPKASHIELSPHGMTLVMFVHPHCPCTRASMAQLERVVAQTNGNADSENNRITPWIVFYKPAGQAPDWEKTDLWRSAERIPGAHVICDEHGDEAKHFDARTSGQTFVFNPAGAPLFEGGITGSRGHEGDNAGHSAIVQIAHQGSSVCRETPVFGCPIVKAKNSQ